MERQYKDSGIEWIGKIPESWEVKRLKNLCTSDTSLIVDGDWIESPDISDEGIRYYTTGNIGDGVFKRQGNGFITESTFQTLNCTPVYPGDLVFSRLNSPIGRSCIIPDDYPICVVAVDNVIVRLDSKYDKRFIMYISMCPGYQETNMLIARGTTMQRMSRTQLQNVDMPIPLLSEQQRIADYLDEKCGEIDSLIALQEQMIEKLKAYKQSVITEAVTKGLDPNAKLAPSGIDWIGVIPEGWNITVLRRFANIILGKMLQPNARSENDSIEQYICAKDVHFEGIDTSDLKKMYFNKTEKEIYQVQKGDLLVVEGGAGAAGSCVLKTDLPNTYIQNSIMIVRPKQGIDIRYIHYFEFSLVKKGYVDYVCNKATIPHFTKDKLSSMPIPLPPLSEQQAIASYLDEKCADIDRLITLKQRKIEKLKDYKKSVIYEAVTGKTIIE